MLLPSLSLSRSFHDSFDHVHSFSELIGVYKTFGINCTEANYEVLAQNSSHALHALPSKLSSVKSSECFYGAGFGKENEKLMSMNPEADPQSIPKTTIISTTTPKTNSKMIFRDYSSTSTVTAPISIVTYTSSSPSSSSSSSQSSTCSSDSFFSSDNTSFLDRNFFASSVSLSETATTKVTCSVITSSQAVEASQQGTRCSQDVSDNSNDNSVNKPGQANSLEPWHHSYTDLASKEAGSGNLHRIDSASSRPSKNKLEYIRKIPSIPCFKILSDIHPPLRSIYPHEGQPSLDSTISLSSSTPSSINRPIIRSTTDVFQQNDNDRHNLIFLDWDDSLFPTSCLIKIGVITSSFAPAVQCGRFLSRDVGSSELVDANCATNGTTSTTTQKKNKSHFDRSKLPASWIAKFKALEITLLKFLAECTSRGLVTIITNADYSWVFLAAKEFLPRVWYSYLMHDERNAHLHSASSLDETSPSRKNLTLHHINSRVIRVISAKNRYEKQFPSKSFLWKQHTFLEEVQTFENCLHDFSGVALNQNSYNQLTKKIHLFALGDAMVDLMATRYVIQNTQNVVVKMCKLEQATTIEDFHSLLIHVHSNTGHFVDHPVHKEIILAF